LELLQETKVQKLDKATGNLKPKTQLQNLQQDSSLGASSKTSSCQKKKKNKFIMKARKSYRISSKTQNPASTPSARQQL
jgi:hypothetical protein